MKRLIASILISAMVIFGLPLNAPVIRENIGERFAQVFTTPDASAAWVFRNFSGGNKAAVFSTVLFQTGFIGSSLTSLRSTGYSYTNRCLYSRFTTTRSGPVTKCYIECSGTNAKINVALYNTDGSIKYVDGSLTDVNGQATYMVMLDNKYFLESGKEYKLAFGWSQGTDLLLYEVNVSGVIKQVAVAQVADTMPSTLDEGGTISGTYCLRIWFE